MTQANRPTGIPRPRSIEEEAAFWDSHSASDYADELEVVTDVRFVKADPKRALTIPLDDDQLVALAARARQQGLDSATLVRSWILEHLGETDRRMKPNPR